MKRILLLLAILLSLPTRASQLPPGFVEQLLAQHLDPTDMVMAPDGRIFITIKSGKIVIVENGALSSTTLLDIPVYTYNEAGLCHMVLDPDFNVNHYYYVYYTTSDATHNRVSRFTANGNSTLPGSEVILLELDRGSLHNGGDMIFGLDGKLYIAVGEGDSPSNPQSFASLLGKVLRLNRDGTIPSDNPFFNDPTVTGRNKAIWALGFRNPFSMDIQPGTGKIFVSDTGAERAEEIDEVQAGKNYGWPLIEGMLTNQTPPANYKDPLYAYLHGFTAFTGCSIVGAAFYNPTVDQFPSQYTGKFFYADYCNGYINSIDPVTLSVQTFATGINRPVTVFVTSDGTLYYLARAGLGGTPEANTSTNEGTLWKVTYTGSGTPVISAQPQNQTTVEGDNVNFIISASGGQPLSYQWLENGSPIAGATLASFTFSNAQLTDDGKKFSCVVSNSFGSVTSQEATLTVNSNTRPVPQFTITLPGNAALYQGGQTIQFSGSANDNEEGVLSPSALTWKIDFHHNTHSHPAMQPTSGISSSSFYIPKMGETSDNVWYRIILTATDSKGLSNSIYQDVFPQKSKIIAHTTPTDLPLILDEEPKQTPLTVAAVVGMTRTLEAPATGIISGVQYLFSSWTPSSPGRSFTFDVPAEDAPFIAKYTVFSIQPQNATAWVGDDVELSIAASDAQPVTYQWLVDGTPIVGATNASHRFTNTQLTDNGKKISCQVSNAFGSITTQEATISVNQRNQSIMFGPLAPVTVGYAPFTLYATATSGLPVTYISSDESKILISRNKATIVGAGTVTITAKQPGNANYNPATDVTQTLVINRATQSITFKSIDTKTFGDASFTLSATTTSGLPIEFSSNNTEVATVNDNKVTIVGVGSSLITASQVGNDNFSPAVSYQALVVSKAGQTITFATIEDKTMGDAPFNLSASSNSGLPVEFKSGSDKISLMGNRVTLLKPGYVTINANQAGDNNFRTTTDLQSFCINPAKPEITTSLSSGTQLLISSSASGNQWYKNDMLIPDATSNTFAPTDAGVYKVKVTADNCSSEFSTGQTFVVTEVVNTASSSEFSIYPNPAADRLTLNLRAFNTHFETEIVIYNAVGKVMEKISNKSEEVTLPLNTYPSGNYFIKASQGSQAYFLKFIKN